MPAGLTPATIIMVVILLAGRRKVDGLADGDNTGMSIVETQTVLDGKVYVGTSNPGRGGEIWRSADGLAWERVADNGLERTSNTSLTPFVVFDGELYAIGVSAGSLDRLKGLEVYRSADGATWEKVVSDGFAQGKERNVTGTLAVFGDRLYLVANTMDPRVLIPNHPSERLPPRGFQLWASDDGAKWAQVGKDGFGAPTSFSGTMTVIGNAAYLSTFDYRKGDRLWRSSDGENWEEIYHQPDPSLFSEGGGVLAYQGHLIWTDNDLARGVAVWRADAEIGQ